MRATAQLLRRRGYAATGLADIVKESGAPKGSLYHDFPGGKDQITLAVLRYASQKVLQTLNELAEKATGPTAVLRGYGALLGKWMAASEFQDSCPITTTLLETTPQNRQLTAAGREAFVDWAGIFERWLLQNGVEKKRAS